MSLIDVFWLPLKAYQLMGSFPLEKGKENALIGMKSCKFILVNLSVSASIVILTLLPMFQLGFADVMRVLSNYNEGSIDIASWIFVYLAVHLMHLTIIWRSFQVKNQMADILNALKTKVKTSDKIIMGLYLMGTITSTTLATSGYIYMLEHNLRY